MYNNSFRLFVSSTFSDFNEERKILQTKVFPEIKRYCSSKNLIFQPIDLRWGISNEAQLDQKTLELCVNEVKFSKLNPHPNFLIMSGDRYGWIPLPYAVEKKEFEIILDLIQNDEKEFLENWYILDKNQIPESYILKERKDEYKDNKTWEIIENSLINILQTAVKKSNLTDEKKNKYFQSATEAEVIEGIFKYLKKTPFQNKLLEKDHTLENKDYENVYAYIRNIKTIDNQNLKNRFIDEDFENVNKFKETLKHSIKKQNILEVNIHLKNAMQSEENASLNYKYETIENEESIFEKTMIKFLKFSIDKYIKDITKEKLESYEQERFKNDKLKDFLDTSRTKALSKIENYLSSDEDQTLVIYGKSGLGKSSLMAKAIQNAEYNHKDKKIIYRFVGSSANLSNTPEILISILKELEINEEIRKVANHQTTKEESEKFEEFCYRIQEHLTTLKIDVIIFIDAIDQLSNKDEFLWLPRNLPINLKIIISALDDKNYEEDSKYYQNLKNKTDNLYQLEEFDETYAEKLVLNILKKYNRTITPTQINYLLGVYKSIKTPLYLSVAIQELRYWKSTDNSPILVTSQKEIIEEFINNLTKFYHHNKELVKRVFNYLYLSEGLSESELLEILSIDEKFINYIAPETYHENVTKELPIVIWARLHSQIKEFLRLEQKDNQKTMNFFHREFNNVIENQIYSKDTHEYLIESIQKSIIKYHDKGFDSNRWGELFIKIIISYEIKYNHSYELINISLFNNEIWLKRFISKFQEYADTYQQLSKILNSISIKKLLLKIIDSSISLYNNDIKLLKKKVFLINTINLSYESINDINNLNKFMNLLENTFLPLYYADKTIWFEEYIDYNISKALLFYINKDNNQAILLLEELNLLLEEKRKVGQDKFSNLLSSIYQNLAIIYADNTDYENVIRVSNLNIKILKDFNINFDNRESDLINSYKTIALTYCDKKNFKKALEYIELANEISKNLLKNFPEIHIGTHASTLNSLAYIYSYIPRYSGKDLSSQNDAYQLIKKKYEQLPRETIFTFLLYVNNYASLLYEKGKKNESLKYIDIYRENYKKLNEYNLENFEYEEIYFNLTKYLYKIKKDMNINEKKLILNELHFLSASLYGIDSEEFKKILIEINTIHNTLEMVVNRNDSCSCGSGKKYKKCCGK